jgi:phosphoglycerate dehydrogenase-like enzyme
LLVTNWGGAIATTVAEAALLGILSCLRRTTYVDLLTHRDRGWLARSEKGMMRSLLYRRVGLHGFGNTARALVGLLRPFQCDISGYDPFVPGSVFTALGVTQRSELRDLYSASDVVSIHCSSTPLTQRVVGRELLGAMKDGSVLVNTARASIVDLEALLNELRSGRLSASLDVFDDEPLFADSPLRHLSNCQLTCHTAGPTPERAVDAGDVTVENIRRYVTGSAPLVNLVALDKYDLQT